MFNFSFSFWARYDYVNLEMFGFFSKEEGKKTQFCRIPFVQRDKSVGGDVPPDFNLKH